MRAAQYDKYGGPEVLHEVTVEVPKLKRGTVLVKVHSTSVNPLEIRVRKGGLRVITGWRFPKGIGMDFAGEVTDVGRGVKDLRPGDRVWGFTGGLPMGRTIAAAEYLRAKPNWLAIAPEGLDLVRAGSLPMVGATSIVALQDMLKVQPGDRLLVRGAGGGVGSIAVQVGKALGAQVTGLAGAGTLDLVRSLGADEALDYRTIKPADLDRFDVIFDMVGTDLAAYRALLHPGGRMASTSFTGAAYIAGSIIYGPQRVQAFTVISRSRYFRELTELVEAGKVVPVIDSVYPLADAAGAHRSLEAGGGRGKRVISVIANS